MIMHPALKRIATCLVFAATLAGCQSVDRFREQTPDPDERLDYFLRSYEQAQRDGRGCKELFQFTPVSVDCQRIMEEIERLHIEFPENMRVLMANATIAYEAGRLDKAQFYVDQLLGRQQSSPEAVILRSRIALDEGNARLALSLLDRQIDITPERFDLREIQAGAYYLKGEYPRARAMLGIAGRLGAPGWRISYHQGLICEAEHNVEAACRFYSTALEQKPDFKLAQSRLFGLIEHVECAPYIDGLGSP